MASQQDQARRLGREGVYNGSLSPEHDDGVTLGSIQSGAVASGDVILSIAGRDCARLSLDEVTDLLMVR
jgi:hypothetical protein